MSVSSSGQILFSNLFTFKFKSGCVPILCCLETPIKTTDLSNTNSSQANDEEHHGHDHGTHDAIGRTNEHKHKHKSNALCGGEWKYPVTCDPSVTADCTYYARWEYLEFPSDQIRFTLTTKYVSNRWLAIGFSESTSMVRDHFISLSDALTQTNNHHQLFVLLKTSASNGCYSRLGGAQRPSLCRRHVGERLSIA